MGQRLFFAEQQHRRRHTSLSMMPSSRMNKRVAARAIPNFRFCPPCSLCVCLSALKNPATAVLLIYLPHIAHCLPMELNMKEVVTRSPSARICRLIRLLLLLSRAVNWSAIRVTSSRRPILIRQPRPLMMSYCVCERIQRASVTRASGQGK